MNDILYISEDEAEEYLYDNEDRYFVSDHRWSREYNIVFRKDGQTYEFSYDEPATELQDGQDRYEGDPVPCYPVQRVEIPTVKLVWNRL